MFEVSARDRSGNLGRSRLRPARPRTAVAVRGPTLAAPPGVVSAGSRAVLRAEGVRRGSPYSVRPVGGGKPLPGRAGAKRDPAPADPLRARGRACTWCASTRAAAPPPLPWRWPAGRWAAARARGPWWCCPVVGWQGSNPFDDRFDGQPDDLPSSGRAPLFRPYTAGLPLGARSQAAPLLAFLDRARLPYDLTTDLSLARRRGPSIGAASAVAVAGDVRWHLPVVARRLRRYVDEGGRVALFGADSFRRPVRLEGDVVTDPGARRPLDPFGERTELSRTGEAPMRVQRQGLGLFRGTDDLLGSFTLFERSVSLDAAGAARWPAPAATPSRRWWATGWARGRWSGWARRDGPASCARSAPAWRCRGSPATSGDSYPPADEARGSHHRRRRDAGDPGRRRGLRVPQGRPRHREARVGQAGVRHHPGARDSAASRRPPSRGPPTPSTTSAPTWPPASSTARPTARSGGSTARTRWSSRPRSATGACSSPSRRACSSPSTARPARSGGSATSSAARPPRPPSGAGPSTRPTWTSPTARRGAAGRRGS